MAHLILLPAGVNSGAGGSGSGHNRGVLSLVCFVVGGLVGWGAAQGGPDVQRAWPVFLRAQILATSATLSLVAAWRLTSVGRVARAPRPVRRACGSCSARPWSSRGERSAGQGSLEAWAVAPTAASGSSRPPRPSPDRPAPMIAVLANVITTAWNAVAVHLMRRDAPFRQRRSTTWVDQSPVLASLVGLLLHVVGPAPAWTADVLHPGRSPAGLLGRRPVHRLGHPPPQPGGAAARCTPCAAGAG